MIDPTKFPAFYRHKNNDVKTIFINLFCSIKALLPPHLPFIPQHFYSTNFILHPQHNILVPPLQQQMLRSLLFAAVFASLLINCYEARTIRLANSFLCAKSGVSVEEGLTQHEKSIQIKGEEISNTQVDSVPILLLTEKAEFKVVFHTNSKECKEKFKIKEDSKGCKKKGTFDGHDEFPKPPHCGESCTGYEVVCTGVKLASIEEQEKGGIVGLKRSEFARMFGSGKCEWEAVIKNAHVLVSDLKDHHKGESCGKADADTKQQNMPVWALVLIAVGGVLILLCIIGIAVSCIIVGVGAKKEGRQQYETRQTGSRSLWNRAAGSISRVQQRFVVIRARPKKAASPGGGGSAFGGGASGFGGRGGGMTTGMGRPPSAYADNITKKGAPSSKYGFV
ncbi:hypothetical protein niasHT_009227 [Heterodera trifolii]|uniref:Uncharacterized protein n=1 Tax=Heterodera trifolii TaxID=157864 RepID=A0ABD2MAU0_9BILA